MLLLIGGRMAWKTSTVESVYNQLEFKEDVLFLGYLEEEQLRKVLGSAFALAYVSLFEGFGLPVVEAMCSEVPVITSMHSALSEVAADAAICVDATKVEAITYGLEKITSDEALRKRLIHKGKLRSKQFNWDLASEAVYQMLKESANQ